VRTDVSNIQFKMNSGVSSVVPDGSALSAIQAAADEWNSLVNTSVHFAPIGTTSAGLDSSDGQNTIAVAGTAASLSAVGDAVALTLINSTPNGQVIETDIALNPSAVFSTTLQPNTYDLQSVITHEFGMLWGPITPWWLRPPCSIR